MVRISCSLIAIQPDQISEGSLFRQGGPSQNDLFDPKPILRGGEIVEQILERV